MTETKSDGNKTTGTGIPNEEAAETAGPPQTAAQSESTSPQGKRQSKTSATKLWQRRRRLIQPSTHIF